MTDPYDRAPSVARRSWQLASVVAVAAGVLAIGVPMVLVNRTTATSAPVSAGPGPRIEPPPPAPRLPSGGVPGPSWSPVGSYAPKGMPNGDGCPAGAVRLLAALRDSDVYRDLAPTETLSDLECYERYALGRTDPAGADPATVVFRYVETTNSWVAISAGTSGSCDGFVPKFVRVHLKGCSR